MTDEYYIIYISIAVVLLILKVLYLIYYCTVVKKRQAERVRAAQHQALVQQQLIHQQWQQQQQQQQQPPQFGGGFAPGFQAQGYDPANYTSIYWNQTASGQDRTDSGLRTGSDLPPSYNSVNPATSVPANPPPYPTNNKY